MCPCGGISSHYCTASAHRQLSVGHRPSSAQPTYGCEQWSFVRTSTRTQSVGRATQTPISQRPQQQKSAVQARRNVTAKVLVPQMCAASARAARREMRSLFHAWASVLLLSRGQGLAVLLHHKLGVVVVHFSSKEPFHGIPNSRQPGNHPE